MTNIEFFINSVVLPAFLKSYTSVMHVEHMPSAGKHLQQNPRAKMFYIDDMMALTQPPLKKQWMPSHPDAHGIIPNCEKLAGSNVVVPGGAVVFMRALC